MAIKTIKLKFDGVMEECFVETRPDGEIVCHTKDDRIVKFPPGTDLKEAAKDHNEANSRVPEPAGEGDDQAAELEAWKKGK